MQRTGDRSGFTLAELLVAMAIFATVMSGLFLMFNGINRTVRQSTAMTESFEIGRSMLHVLHRDLSTAFTAREQGDKFQFYGRPDGFMFVGSKPGGGLRRVSYIMYRGADPVAGKQQFRTFVHEPPQYVYARVRTQALETARRLGFTLADQQLAADRAGLAYCEAFDIPHPPGENAMPKEHEVMVTTASLLRFEESDKGRTNLNAFSDARVPALWIDSAAVPELYQGSPALNAIFYAYALNAGLSLTTVDAGVLQIMIDAERRSLWLHELSWNFNAVTGNAARDYVIADRILYATEALNPNDGAPLLLPPPRAELAPVWGLVPMDILYQAAFFRYGKGDIGADGGTPLTEYFNANENLDSPDASGIGYRDFLREPSAATLVDFDQTLTRAKQDKTRASSMGSPLDPGLPYVVAPGFWIMMESPQIGMRDLRRWFEQIVDVPSGYTRAPVGQLQVRRP